MNEIFIRFLLETQWFAKFFIKPSFIEFVADRLKFLMLKVTKRCFRKVFKSFKKFSNRLRQGQKCSGSRVYISIKDFKVLDY